MKLYRGKNLLHSGTRYLLLLTILVTSLALPSCTVTTRVTSNLADNACPDAGKHLCHRGGTHWVYFWGRVNEKTYVANQCSEHNLTTVDFKQNYLYTAISFLTLGIVTPVKVEWNCSAGRG